MHKHQVRELASKHALPTMSRKDSQGICFLGKLKFEEFIGHYLGENNGEIYDYETNDLIGKHKGTGRPSLPHPFTHLSAQVYGFILLANEKVLDYYLIRVMCTKAHGSSLAKILP